MSTSSYAAGSKVYRGVSSAPNIGPVTNKEGYAQRDLEYKTRKAQTLRRNNALLKRVKAKQQKRYISADNLSAPEGRTV
jgi:hypothetical protein